MWWPPHGPYTVTLRVRALTRGWGSGDAIQRTAAPLPAGGRGGIRLHGAQTPEPVLSPSLPPSTPGHSRTGVRFFSFSFSFAPVVGSPRVQNSFASGQVKYCSTTQLGPSQAREHPSVILQRQYFMKTSHAQPSPVPTTEVSEKEEREGLSQDFQGCRNVPSRQ